MHTEHDVRETARRIATEHPFRENPRSGYVCVYTDPEDPSNHCFGGEILLALGETIPDAFGPANTTAIPVLMAEGGFWSGKFEEEALPLLAKCQQYADGFEVELTHGPDAFVPARPPRAWGGILPILDRL